MMYIPEVIVPERWSLTAYGNVFAVHCKLWFKAATAARMAYAPHSNFYVGSALITPDGHVFSGCNVECVDYDGTHAEETAIGQMVMAGERKIAAILSVAAKGAPDAVAQLASSCGKCRQKIREFAGPETLVAVASVQENGQVKASYLSLEVLLPYSFGPELVK